jgi:hypothetical protein
VQRQQRQHLRDPRGLPRPRGQHRRAEPLPLASSTPLSLTRGARTGIAPAAVPSRRRWRERTHPWCIALLGTNFGSSVERTASLHPLWRYVVEVAGCKP